MVRRMSESPCSYAPSAKSRMLAAAAVLSGLTRRTTARKSCFSLGLLPGAAAAATMARRMAATSFRVESVRAALKSL